MHLKLRTRISTLLFALSMAAFPLVAEPDEPLTVTDPLLSSVTASPGSSSGQPGDGVTVQTADVTAASDPGANGDLPQIAAAPAPGFFVAVGEGGTVLTSPDGATWTAQASGVTTARLRAATRKAGLIVVVGEAGTVLTSPDGSTWTSVVSGIPEGLRGVAASSTLFVAVGGQNTGRIFTSLDGSTWNEITLTAAAGKLRAVAHDGTRFVAVGAGGSILSSTDGANWSSMTSGTAERLDGIVWTGSAFEVISETGKFLRSADGGTTWSTPVAGNAPSWVEGMVWSGSRVVVVGSGGRIRTSDDGETWTQRTSTVTSVIHGVTYTGAFVGQTMAASTLFGNLRKLTVTGITASNKTYDRTATATLTTTGATLVGVFAGDTVNLDAASVTGATGAFADADAGSAKTVTVSGLTISGTHAADYTLTQPTTTANITAAGVTVSGLSASNKSYDRTTAATLTGTPTVTGAVSGDTVTVSGTATTGTFVQASVGTGIAVTPTLSGLTLSSTNYTITGVTTALSANITPAGVTISGLSASNKTYDRTTAATLTGTPTVTGAVSGDTVTVSGTATAGTFVQASVGTGIAVTPTLSGLTLSSTNYTITGVTTALSANITPAGVTISGLSASNKTYDRTTAATLTGTPTVAGAVSGDTVTVSGTATAGTFVQASVGTGIAVTPTLSGLTLSSTNYTITGVTTALSANITPAGVTISGLSASNKTYDRTTAATLTGTPTVAGAVSGDTVTVSGTATAGTFVQASVGTGIAVTPTLSGLTLSSTNYTITGVTTALLANITPAGVTISGLSASNKTYDRTTAATLTGTPTVAGAVSGDSVTVSGTATSGTFAQASVGTGIAVTPTLSGLTLSSTDYTITGVTTALSANITAAGVTISGLSASNKTYDRTTAATLTGTPTVAGVVSGDTVTVSGTATAGTFVQPSVGTGIAVTPTLSGLTLSSSNYTITGVTTALTANITAKTLTVTGTTAANKVYDGTVTATPSFTSSALSGVIAGDTVAIVSTGGSATFANKTIGTGKTVTIAGLTLSGGDAGNYLLTQPTTTADITAKALTVSGAKALDKTYDGTASASLDFSGAQLVGVASGDVVSLVSSAAKAEFADANAGNLKTVTVTGLSISGTDSGNYTLTAPALAATILRAPVTFTFTGLSQAYDGTSKRATVVVSPEVPYVVTYSDGASVLNMGPVNVGNYTVTGATTNPNYAGVKTSAFVITKAAQTVSIKAPATATLAEPVAVSATSSAGLPVVLTVTGPATLSQGKLQFTAPGAAVITATQAGNANYAEATTTATVTAVGKAAQTIAFAAPADRLSNSGPLTLTATATSGLSVSFTVVSGPALLSGNVVTLRGDAGRVIVRASQGGDARFEAAPDVTVSFQVTAATVNVFFGTVSSASAPAASPKVGDIAAALPPNSNQGSLLVVAPAVGLNRALDFQLNPDGTFEQTFVIDGPAAGGEGTPPVAAAPITVKVKGRLVGGRLSGTVEPLGLSFDAPVLPVTGSSANAAGFYRSSTLANTTGATYSVVGTNNQVLVLAATPAVTTGGLTTLNTDGTFALQTTTTAGAATIRGTVDEPSTTVAGSITIGGQTTQYAGVVTTTTRTDRLVNLSSRVRISGGDSVLITGFVVGGERSKQVLVRGIGPALTGFGVNGALANPKLRIYRGSTLVSENDDWTADTAAAFSRLGAFSLPAGSRDAALLVTLEPGAYTAHVSDGGAAGVALAEIYDASANPAAEYQRLINISTRGEVTAGEGVLIGGFVVTGNAPKRLLIRGVGPGLAAFGVGGVLADPRLRVYRNAELQAENDNWSTVAVEATAAVEAARTSGAFALTSGSRDAALIVTLAPGAYTAQITASDGTSSGSALIEIYELQP